MLGLAQQHFHVEKEADRLWEKAMGDSSRWLSFERYRGTICRLHVFSWKVCCLPGAHIRDVTEKLPSFIQSTDYHLLLLFQMGTSDTVGRSLRSIKKDYRALEVVVKDSGSQGAFLINPAGQSKGIWKGQSNLANRQMVTGLMPQPGVQLHKPWDSLSEPWGLMGSICQRRRRISSAIALSSWWTGF